VPGLRAQRLSLALGLVLPQRLDRVTQDGRVLLQRIAQNLHDLSALGGGERLRRREPGQASQRDQGQ
jgi:hypothetical protein